MSKEMKIQLDYFLVMGMYYGYPKCCIEDFCYRYRLDAQANVPNRQSLAGNHTGFLPCPIHSEEVLSGKKTLKQLIKKRVHYKLFPNDLCDEGNY